MKPITYLATALILVVAGAYAEPSPSPTPVSDSTLQTNASKNPQIVVIGNVLKPGLYPYKSGMKLLSVIFNVTERDGFEQQDFALIRSGKETRFRIDEIVKNPDQDVKLEPWDIIYFREHRLFSRPESELIVTVTHGDKNPVTIPYTKDMTLMSALVAAAELNPGASAFDHREHIILVRHGNRTRVDTRNMTKDPTLDIKLLPGDALDYPESLW